MAKKTKAVAKKSESSTDVAIPDHLRGTAGRGTENIGMGDIETPRLILLQALSDQVKDGQFKAGHFMHSILEKDLGDELTIVPIYVTQQALLWRPRHEGGGILARSMDGRTWSPPDGEWEVHPYKEMPKKTVTWRTKPTVEESGLLEWGSTDPDDANSQPAATRIYAVVVAVEEFPELGPIVIAMQRSQIKVARKLNGKLKMSPVACYGQRFKMTSIDDDSPSGEFKNFSFEGIGYVEDAARFAKYEELYNAFSEKGVVAHGMESEDGEESGVEGGDAAVASGPAI